MGLHLRISSCVSGLGVWLLTLGLLARPGLAETSSETNTASNATNQLSALVAAQMETLVRLQAQQASTLQMLQQSRLEMAAALAAVSSNNMAHLNTMSEMLAQQRAQDATILRNSSRVVLAVLVGITGFLVVSIIFLNVTSTRAINQLVKMLQTTTLVPTNALPSHNPRQLLLLPEEKGQMPLNAALAQLKQQIQAIEQVAQKSQSADAHAGVEAAANHKTTTGKAVA